MDDRDKFALSILPAIYTEYFAKLCASGTGPQDEHWRKGLALDAYSMADAMLAVKSGSVTHGVAAPMPFGELPDFPGIRGALRELT